MCGRGARARAGCPFVAGALAFGSRPPKAPHSLWRSLFRLRLRSPAVGTSGYAAGAAGAAGASATAAWFFFRDFVQAS